MCSKTTVDVHIRWLLNSCMFCTSSSFYRQFIGLGYCHCIDIPSLVFLRSTLLFVIPEYETNQPQNSIMLVWAETFLLMYSFILSYCKTRKYLRVVPTHLRHLRDVLIMSTESYLMLDRKHPDQCVCGLEVVVFSRLIVPQRLNENVTEILMVCCS